MTALRGGDIDRLIAKPDSRYPVILVYGQDAGLVAERAAAIAANAVADRNDPFQLLRLDGDEIASDPLRLADEANTASMFGGRRAIRVRVGSRGLAPLIEPLLRAPPVDAIVVLEAGELRANAPLRALCEKSPRAAAIPCYLDDPAALRGLIDEALKGANATIEPDARSLVMSMLGGDRRASRSELDKLIAFAGEGASISVADVEAAMGDAGAIAVNEAIDAAFSGRPAELLPALAKLAAEGMRADGVLIPALNHGWLLAQGRAQMDAGQGARGFVEERMRNQFRRKDAFERQLGLWPRDALEPVLKALGEAIFHARRQAELGRSHADRVMLRIALAARNRSR